EPGTEAKNCRQGNRHALNYVAYQTNSSDSDDYVFALYGDDLPTAQAQISTKLVAFVVDTGATVNVLSMKQFLRIKGPNDRIRPTTARVFSFGSKVPLQLEGEWT